MVSRSVWEHEEGRPLSLFRDSLAILFLQKTENRKQIHPFMYKA